VIGLFGGAFDPPHNGHVALLARARSLYELGEIVVLVSSQPGHKQVATPAPVRLALARAAFPDATVVLDDHPRTIDTLRAHPEWEGAVFLLGADEFLAFPSWKEPDEVLKRVKIAVATRPGHPTGLLDDVRNRLSTPDRIVFFALEPMPIASSDLRERLDRGEEVSEWVPAEVWHAIDRDALYGRGYTADG
jgi:nicotinate-nucleotide adenylyltransferase